MAHTAWLTECGSWGTLGEHRPLQLLYLLGVQHNHVEDVEHVVVLCLEVVLQARRRKR